MIWYIIPRSFTSERELRTWSQDHPLRKLHLWLFFKPGKVISPKPANAFWLQRIKLETLGTTCRAQQNKTARCLYQYRNQLNHSHHSLPCHCASENRTLLEKQDRRDAGVTLNTQFRRSSTLHRGRCFLVLSVGVHSVRVLLQPHPLLFLGLIASCNKSSSFSYVVKSIVTMMFENQQQLCRRRAGLSVDGKIKSIGECI